MSSCHEHTSPSVLALISWWALVVPTTFRAYTGCVCPPDVSGVLSTGCDLARVSHSRICPEYAPPTIMFGLKSEKVTFSTSDGAWNTNSGRSFKCVFQIATTPSGSLGAIGFLLYAAATSSVKRPDQATSITERPRDTRSSLKAMANFSFSAADSSSGTVAS
ncbi:hypothetical protein FBU59_005054, partial [Linderina macrospora]